MKINLGELKIEQAGIKDVKDDLRLFYLMADGNNNAGLRITSVPQKIGQETLNEFCADDRAGQKYKATIILERVEDA